MNSQANAPMPPDRSTVIGRAVCLASLVVRGTLESAIALANSPEDAEPSQELAQRLSYWLSEQDFSAQFTLSELEALCATPGTWTPEQHEAQGERIEATGVLLWALSLHEKFPACHEPFDFPDLQPLLGWPAEAVVSPNSEGLSGFPCNGADLLFGITRLRPAPEFIAQRGVAECWQWRAQVAARQRSEPTPPPGHDYAMLIGIAAEEAHAAGAIGRPICNDFPLNGRPFAKAPEAVQSQCARLAAARQLALDWLCGYATRWDFVPVLSPDEGVAC